MSRVRDCHHPDSIGTGAFAIFLYHVSRRNVVTIPLHKQHRDIFGKPDFIQIKSEIHIIDQLCLGGNDVFRVRREEEPSGGIQEDAYVEIGGIEQFMQIRGEDKNNPVVLWLHGGPGFPLTYMNWYYQGELEKDYTVACLEQRGCGRTYYKNDKNNKAANASPDELLSDIHEAVEYLKKRFHKDKVILMAQSWGTVIGMKYTEQHPENVAAYVGVGQVTQFAKGKLYSAQKAADLAERQGNTRDAETSASKTSKK